MVFCRQKRWYGPNPYPSSIFPHPRRLRAEKDPVLPAYVPRYPRHWSCYDHVRARTPASSVTHTFEIRVPESGTVFVLPRRVRTLGRIRLCHGITGRSLEPLSSDVVVLHRSTLSSGSMLARGLVVRSVARADHEDGNVRRDTVL
jgi:hypothetical protein